MSLEELFIRAEAVDTDGSFLRIDETHPVGIFLGVEGGQRAIMIVCPTRPPAPPSLEAITVEARPRGRGEWALVIRLERRDLVRPFTQMAQDIASTSLSRPDAPGDVAIAEIIRWQQLFARRSSTALDDHELRGLAGELLFLIEEASPCLGPISAATAWVGPYEAPKDFTFDGVEVEVKAITRQPRVIRISSFEQLTDAGLPLYLWCKNVEIERDRGVNSTLSISSLVRAARACMAFDAMATQLLEDGLASAGYCDRPEYDRCFLRLGPARCFQVSSGFPRLQRKDVQAGIISGSYEIQTTAIAPYEVTTWYSRTINGH